MTYISMRRNKTNVMVSIGCGVYCCKLLVVQQKQQQRRGLNNFNRVAWHTCKCLMNKRLYNYREQSGSISVQLDPGVPGPK